MDAPGLLYFWGLRAAQVEQLEHTTEGTLILEFGDCNFQMARYVESPVRIAFEAGRIAAVEGGLDAVLIRDALTSAEDDGAWNAGHIAR